MSDAAEPAQLAPSTILVVDDNEAVRYLTRRILQREGYGVVEAATGSEALAQAARLPGMVVLDVNLPDFSGFEVCRRLRADPRTAHIPVLHLSASFQDDDSVVTGLEGGADGYLTLPVEPTVLLAYVRALLRVGEALRSLQQSEARFRSLFESMGDGLLLADPVDRRFRMANPAICELLGYTKDELEGMWITDIHSPETLETLRGTFDEVLAGRAPLVPGLAALRKDGSTFHVDIANTLLTIDDRTMVLGAFRDVTERRALEQRLAQADRLASVGLLAAGVAHELNNPLAYVLYNLDAATEDLAMAADRGDGLSAEQVRAMAEKLGASRDGAQRMRSIVHDLQTFSRVDRRDHARVELPAVLRAVTAMAAHQVRFRARLELDLREVPPVMGNEGHLSQVFLNLLVNAAHAIEEDNPEAHRIRVRCGRMGDEVAVEVSDTGQGIPEDQRDRIFDPFFTTKAPGQGTGLGLAICHRIVTEHGGRIELSSTVGAGSSFRVHLPCALPQRPTAPPPAAPASQVDTNDAAAAQRPRLLIVDDERHLRRAMARLLERAGYDTQTAATGLEAQRILLKGAEFDVILCDLMMPELNGMDLHAWLVREHPALARRVIFLTGGTFTPKAERYLASTENPMLSKPLPQRELVAAIDAMLER